MVQDTVELLLGLLRNSNVPRRMVATAGIYQKSLDPQRPVEMIRVSLDPRLHLFAEISGSKHRFCIRFMESSDWEHPVKQASLRSRERFWDIRVPKIDSIFDNSLVPRPSWSPGVPPQHRKLVAATHRSPI